ncbi:hypothetical protein MMC09_000698 [Bachmanniomyces sp. S44760]|nr:hypothetical protein [Bachmanniomyces sp. S44760]
MASYYYGPQHHQQSVPSSHSSHNNHHGGRARRAPRLSSSQNSHRQFRGVRSMKELTEAPAVPAFRLRFEAGRSFDLDDDLEFCPGLLTEDDVSTQSVVDHYDSSVFIIIKNHHHANLNSNLKLHSIHSSSSDRSSLSSGSPDNSPLQHQIQPTHQVTQNFSLSSASNNSYNPATGFTSSNVNDHQLKIHQPSALRTRNAIPIVNPSTGMRVPSPPPNSISPARMQQQQQQQTYNRHW